MLAAESEHGLVFKMNCGRPGVVSGSCAVGNFKNVKLGEIVDVMVTGWSMNKEAIFLDRLP